MHKVPDKKPSSHPSKMADARNQLKLIADLFKRRTKHSFSAIIQRLVMDFEKAGVISPEEKKMVKNIVLLGDKKASNIMTPRADITALHYRANIEQVRKIIVVNQHTRIPVYRENLDDVIGFIHSKDMVKFLDHSEENFAIDKILRKILFVPSAIGIVDLMVKMRMSRIHIAMVLDEFGGADGLVTIENVVEEIVGEIEDEHDLPSESAFFRIRKIDENTIEAGGRAPITKIEEVLQLKLKSLSRDFETVSGLVIAIFNRVPESGEEIEKDGLRVKVLAADNRVIRQVELKKL